MSVYRTIGPLVKIIIFCFVVAICDLVHAVEAIYVWCFLSVNIVLTSSGNLF